MTLGQTGARPPRTLLRLAAWLLMLGAFFSVAALYWYLRSTHRPAGASGPARSLSAEQSQLLVQNFSKYPAHTLVIKCDPSDPEAKQLSQELYDSLRTSPWHVDLSTDGSGPPVGPGLFLAQTGEALRPSYPDRSQDPYFFLPGAFTAAHVNLTGQSGQAAGEYRLYLVVGPREPSRIAGQRHGYILGSAGRWALRHLRALRGGA